MRNVFDQYSQPENRVTHALVSSLSEDPALLRRFLKWVLGTVPAPARSFSVIEQQLPGESEATEEEAEKRGLPDACIYDNSGWALVIEAKVSAGLSSDQLRRHLKTVRSRGFKQVRLLLLTVKKTKAKLPANAIHRTWSQVYEWLCTITAQSKWAHRAARYLEVAERRFTDEGYLKEGTLTVFAGIPFTKDTPYNYHEAKRILKLAMAELRIQRDLVRMVPAVRSRPAITGQHSGGVWDVLGSDSKQDLPPFSKNPHFSLSVDPVELVAVLMVPDALMPAMRKKLRSLKYDAFEEAIRELASNLGRVLRRERGAVPKCVVLQRHYRSQRSRPTVDAKLDFDLRTAFPAQLKDAAQGVKAQPQWLRATYDSIQKKRSNIGLHFGASFPYATCPSVRSRKILDHIANTWRACKPLLDVLQ